MLQSLRFRLPAFFLAGVALAGIVSTAIAVQLFQEHIRSQSLAQLKREARGLTELYQQAAIRSSDEGRSAPEFAATELEQATATRLFYVGSPIFPGQAPGLQQLPQSEVDWAALQDGQMITLDFTPPGEHKTFLAVGQPLRLPGGDSVFGALVVAKQKTELTQGWFTLVKLLFVALGVGLSSPERSPGTSRAGSPGPCWRSRRPPTASPAASTTSRSPRARTAARSAISPTGSARWPPAWPRPRSRSGTS